MSSASSHFNKEYSKRTLNDTSYFNHKQMNFSPLSSTHGTSLLENIDRKLDSASKLTTPPASSLSSWKTKEFNTISPSSLSSSPSFLSSSLSPLQSSSFYLSSSTPSPRTNASPPLTTISPSTPNTPSLFSRLLPLTPANKYPSFKQTSPLNVFIEDFISKLTELSSASEIASSFLEAAEMVDNEFQFTLSLFPSGIPTFASFQYNWQSNPFEKKHGFLHTTMRKLLPKHAFIGASSLMVDLIHLQKKVYGSESTHCSLGHQIFLNTLVSQFSYPLLSGACRPGHAHLFSWLDSVFPAYWTDAPTGLSICWLFQQFVLNPPLTKNSFPMGHRTPDEWYNDLQTIYVEYIGQHFMTPNAAPSFLHVALVLLTQLIKLESRLASYRFQPELLNLLLQLKRADISNKRIAMLLADVASERRRLVEKLFAATQTIHDIDYWATFIPVLWFDEDASDVFNPVREEVAAIIHGFLFLPNRINWWSVIYKHACSHPKITKEILVSLDYESVDRLLGLQKELRLLSGYLLLQRHRPDVNEAYIAACHLIGAQAEPIPSMRMSVFPVVTVLIVFLLIIFVQPSPAMGLLHGTFWRAHQLLWYPSLAQLDFSWISLWVNWILDSMDHFFSLVEY